MRAMSDSRFDEDLPEVERYEQREPQRYSFAPGRREFMQTLGAGLMVYAAVQPAAAQRRRGPMARQAELLSERFHLGEDGIVTVFTSKVEVGQGSRTEITQAAAEEFHLPIERIRLVMADTQLCPDDGGTAGSRTTPATVPRVRNAAAAAHAILAGEAAARLKVSEAELQIRDDGDWEAGGERLSLADLAKDKEILEKLKTAPPASGIKVAPVQAWKVLGTSVPKVSGRDIVTGAARYPSDIIRPNMHYGRWAVAQRPPRS
jgi:isoquinoline 1-oxidoreductase